MQLHEKNHEKTNQRLLWKIEELTNRSSDRRVADSDFIELSVFGGLTCKEKLTIIIF